MVLLLVSPHSTYTLQMMIRGQDDHAQDNPPVVTGDDDVAIPARRIDPALEMK
jgi:hypothetical protein